MQKPTENPVLTDPAMRACFDALPLSLQENILQSGIPLRSVEEIQAYAEHYTQENSKTEE